MRVETQRISSSPSSSKESDKRSRPSFSSAPEVREPLRVVGPSIGLGADDQGAPNDLALRPKMTVNGPGDKYEREAERVADAVMRIPDPESKVGTREKVPLDRIQRMCPRCQRRYRQGKSLNCEECEQELQRKPEADSIPVAEGVEQAAAVAGEPGKPLSDKTKSFFEDRMGGDFGDVRIHTGTKADRAARSINAEAFTVGRDVAFRSGAYRPATTTGKRLLAHELTHVVQQTGDRPARSDTASRARAGAVVQRVEYVDCDTKKWDESKIESAIGEAKSMVKAAINALEKNTDELVTHEREALQNHFSVEDDLKSKVKKRYQSIRESLDDKRIVCRDSCSTDEEETDDNVVVDECGRAKTPGRTIYLCPAVDGGCDPAATLLHEAAHNEGAGHGEDGPYDNAYAFEDFAKAVAEGPDVPAAKLPMKQEREVK